MDQIAIKAENISKAYQLGEFSTGTLSRDIERRWALLRGKEDPFLTIGEANDRASKGTSNVVWSLKDINFEIKQGDAVGIVGRNGAGKSTLLKVLSRVTTPTTGTIKVKGRIASLLEVGTGFHPELTGRENIYLNGAILGMRKKEITRKFDQIIDFAGIERYIDTPVKRYSSGMYVRLAFAVAAHLESETLIVDEVLAVGDAEFQKKCLGKMGEVSKGEGRTVLFVSHNMASVKNLCSQGILMKNGQIDYTGTSTEVVDYYVSNYVSFNTANRVEIDNSHSTIKGPKEVKFVEIAFIGGYNDNQFATLDDITLEITLLASITSENIRIALGINNMEEQCVGVHFTESKFKMKEGERKKIQLKISNHQLAKGQYYFDFSIGTGDEVNGIRDFDIVQKTLFFEITYKDKNHDAMISVWDSQWGSINFTNVLLEEV